MHGLKALAQANALVPPSEELRRRAPRPSRSRHALRRRLRALALAPLRLAPGRPAPRVRKPRPTA